MSEEESGPRDKETLEKVFTRLGKVIDRSLREQKMEESQCSLAAMRKALTEAIGAIMFAVSILPPHQGVARKVLAERIDELQRVVTTNEGDEA